MIDIEADIFTTIENAVKTAHPNVYCTSEYVPVPPKLPCVSIVEADNRVLARMRTTNVENAASVMYEVNIYSNKASMKKSEAKAITSTLDSAFAEIGFTRTMRNQVPNFNDATIYRIVCRYEAVVDKDFWIYHN